MGKEKTNERHQHHFILVQTRLPKRKRKQIYRQKNVCHSSSVDVTLECEV